MSTVITDVPQPTAELGSLEVPGLFPASAGDVGIDGSMGLRNIQTPQVVYVHTSSRMANGDLLELFSNDPLIPVAHTFVQPGDLQQARLPLLLPAASIRPLLIDPLVCRNNLTGESTQTLRLRVDLNMPGGLDPDVTTPGHQGLVFKLPADVMVNGVSNKRAREGIEVEVLPYPFIAVGDRLLLCWGDQQVTHSVSEKDLRRSIILVVPYDTIIAAGDSDRLNVQFQVRGHTGNDSDPAAPWSAASEARVFARDDFLYAPFINEADPQTRVIDLAKLEGKSITANVYADPNYFSPNDTLEFFFQGTDAHGNPVTYGEKTRIDQSNKLFEFPISHELVAKLVQGHAKVQYTLHKFIEGITFHSVADYVTVQGVVAPWTAPYMNEVQPFAHVQPVPFDGYAYVPYQESWKPTDLITLVWLVPDPEGAVEYRFSRSAGERPEHNVLEFHVPGAQTKRFEGRPSVMYYEATDSRAIPRLLGQSARKNLLVGERWAPMAAPEVERVIGHRLDPDLVPDGVWVTLPNPPLGRDIRLHWFGPGNRIEMLVRANAPGEARVKVPAKFVLDNLNRIVKVYWLVNLGGTPQRYSGVTTVRIARRHTVDDENLPN
ncbi:hypothetical protein RCO22_08885 [Pseudomonas yamanorum]|uniref:Uncharacterized protein n=1 Tax=Pseudomonas yamanorum TaxID=515393 RepID=A0ABU1CP59_9PSED|nr:hypothetical protein [Pseudomonas yamanorum]MDR0189049.1 hypothetical protein [Pseudomonas yamanorum]